MSTASLPTSIRPSTIRGGARPANGISARAYSGRGNPPFPSTATPRRWPVSTQAWICGNTFDVADPVGSEAAGVPGMLDPGSAPDRRSAQCHRRRAYRRHLAGRRPGRLHAAYLRPVDAQLRDDHPVHDAAQGVHALDHLAAVSPDVRVIRV